MKALKNSKQESRAMADRSEEAVQTKLFIGEPNDAFEQEADQVADKVVSAEKTIQQKPAALDEEEQLERKQEDEEEEIQMKPKLQLTSTAREKGETTTPWLEQQIKNSEGKGQPLPDQTRTFMESQIGARFGDVKAHTNTTAVQMNRQLGARAFTVGKNIFFNSGEYAPQSREGKRLLAHELTHTVQQGASPGAIQRDLAVEPPSPEAVGRQLSEQEVQEAIQYNSARFPDPAEIRNLRDVLGINPEPAIIDADLVNAVVQWQAENNLTQDGKIGPLTARVIGREILEESALVPDMHDEAVAMLERGIVLSFANNTYVDTATTSRKTIRFNVYIPQGLNMRDYALVNFISGEILRMPGPAHPNVRMYGNLVPFNFPSQQVDSVDADPIYWSDASGRWNYNIAGRTFWATDSPGRSTGLFNPGDVADLDFRIGVYRLADLPATTTGTVGSARAITSAGWRFSVRRDAVTGNITHP